MNRDRLTGRHTDSQADKNEERRTDIKTERQIDTHAGRDILKDR